MSVNKESDDEGKPRILIFSDVDPREQNFKYLHLANELLDVAAYVVPFVEGVDEDLTLFNNTPVISWKEPHQDVERAEQYLYLYKVSIAEAVVHLGWEYRVPGASEAGEIVVYKLLYQDMSGLSLSLLIYLRLGRKIPQKYRVLTYEQRGSLSKKTSWVR